MEETNLTAASSFNRPHADAPVKSNHMTPRPKSLPGSYWKIRKGIRNDFGGPGYEDSKLSQPRRVKEEAKDTSEATALYKMR